MAECKFGQLYRCILWILVIDDWKFTLRGITFYTQAFNGKFSLSGLSKPQLQTILLGSVAFVDRHVDAANSSLLAGIR